MKVSRIDKVRLSFYMSKELVQQIEACADSLGIDRGSMISVMCKNYLDGQKALSVSNNASALQDLLNEISSKISAGTES